MIRCSVTITNTGSQKGAEVIQLYLKENQPSVLRPEKELKRFKKIFLNSGENQTVEFEITPEDLAFWDDETHDWKVNSGQYSILLGTSSRHISHILSFTKNDCIAVILLGDTISMNFSYDGKSKGLDISAKGF